MGAEFSGVLPDEGQPFPVSHSDTYGLAVAGSREGIQTQLYVSPVTESFTTTLSLTGLFYNKRATLGIFEVLETVG